MHISVDEYVMWLKESDYIRVQQKMELGEKWTYKSEETLHTFWHILFCTQTGLKFDSHYVSVFVCEHYLCITKTEILKTVQSVSL